MSSLLRSPWVSHLSTFVAGALAVALIFKPTHSIPPGPELGAPTRLPALARAALHGRMQRHGQQLGTLVVDAVLLDRGEVSRIAGEIYDEPRLARPLPGDALEGQLPERFFQLQDDLRAHAKRLVAAAATDAPTARLSDELAALTKTCVACHDAYLHDALAPAPHAAAAGDATP
jgi:cytochrome c553